MNNSYLNDRKAINRLKSEYLKHGTLIIGFDFDNTIYDYYNEGLEVQPLIDLLHRCSINYFTMCLYSLSLDELIISAKINFCSQNDIYVNFINESPIMQDSYPKDKRKPFFSILLDDRAGLSAAYNILKTTLDELGL
jgi:hypothetical protein